MQKYQGDISIIKITKDRVKNLSFSPLSEKLVIAEGEVTGHRHLLVAERPETKIEIAKDKYGYYIKVDNGNAILTHDKHEVKTITPGIWFIGVQEEYTELGEWKQVQD